MKYLCIAVLFACLLVSIAQAEKAKPQLVSPITKKTWEPGETLAEQYFKDAAILIETIFPSKTKRLSAEVIGNSISTKNKPTVGRDFVWSPYFSNASKTKMKKLGEELLRSHKFDHFESQARDIFKKAQDEVETYHGVLIDDIDSKYYQVENQGQADFLKRYILLLAWGGLKYRSEKGRTDYRWPMTLGAAISHGQRVLIRLHKGRCGSHLLFNLLWTGDQLLLPGSAIYNRKISSHATDFIDGEIQEIKVKFNPIALMSGVYYNRHKGADFAWGGPGNIGPTGKMIFWKGRVMGVDEPQQLGHMYAYLSKNYKDKNSEKHSALLIGFETTGPGNKNPFGRSHNFMSGIKSQDMERSVSGGPKLSQLPWLWKNPPSQMLVDIDLKNLHEFEAVLKEFFNLSLENQKKLIKSLLESNALRAHKNLWHHYKKWLMENDL